MIAVDALLLVRFRAALVPPMGTGSRARGDARPDSDYDVAVFPKG